MMIPRAAVINDLSGLGRCSLTAAISVLSAMGVQPCPLPTAVLTAQTGYSTYFCRDLTDDMPQYTAEWSKLGEKFDGIYTGFLTGDRQVGIIHDFLGKFREEKTLLLVDPILGDDGVPYDFYNRELLRHMRGLVDTADIATPNLTELCLLTDEDFRIFEEAGRKGNAAFFEKIKDMASLLLNRTGKRIVVTGIRYTEDVSGSDQMGNLLLEEGRWELFSYPHYSGSFSGTGDLMASILLGGMLRGDTAEESLALAGRFLDASIKAAAAAGTPSVAGVHYEPYMKLLCR